MEEIVFGGVHRVQEENAPMKTVTLHDTIEVLKPDAQFFIDKIEAGQALSYIKLNHGYWQMAQGDPRWVDIFEHMHEKSFIDECKIMIKSLPIDSDASLLLGVSHLGPPDQEFDIDNDQVIKAIRSNTPQGPLYFGPIWKHYTLTKQILSLFYSLRRLPVVVVGLSHLKSIGERLGIKMNHFLIHVDASCDRHVILDCLREVVKEPCAILFQAGEMLSAWLINHLHGAAGVYLFDMGRSLDYWADNSDFSLEDQDRYKRMMERRQEPVRFPTIFDVFPDQSSQLWKRRGIIKVI